MQFMKLFTAFSESKLNPTEQVILAFMYDRMNLSKDNGDKFYDKKRHAYYITYTRQELAEAFNITENTVTRATKSLAKKGWLIVVQSWNSGNRIFLPISLETKNDSSKNKNLCSNQTKPNHTDTQKHDTNHTDDLVKQDAQNTTDNSFVVTDIFNALKDSLHHEAGFPIHMVNVMADYSFGNPDKLSEYAGIILKAKSINAKLHTAKGSSINLIFEENMKDFETMNLHFKRIFSRGGKVRNFGAYLYKSSMNYFTKILTKHGEYIADKSLMKQYQDKPTVPMFKIA